MATPTILQTATAVPVHLLTQESVKQNLYQLLPLPEHRRPAVLAMFDHALVATRHSVLPLGRLRERRTLSETSAVYREHAVQLGREVADRCLTEAGVPARAIDLVITRLLHRGR